MRNLFLLLVFGISCTTCNRMQNKSALADNSSPVKNDSILANPKMRFEKRDWIITDHKIGQISTNSQIEKSIEIIGRDFTVLFDSIDWTDSGYGTGLEYYYQVNFNNEQMFIIHPDALLHKINTIEVINRLFSTDKEFRIGDTFGELRKKYSIDSSSFNYDDGLFVYSRDFEGAFRLASEELETYQIDSIPLNTCIDRIVIY